MNDCIPFYDDGDHITGYCTAAVTGKRFVKISGTRTGGVFDPTQTTPPADKGAPNIALADIGGRVHGVAAYDGALHAFVDVVRGSKMVVPVAAGAPLSAFDEVAVGPGGSAVPAGSEVGVAAALTVDPTGTENGLDFTANEPGSQGNDISVTYAAASGGHPAKSVAVSGEDITVYVTADTTTAQEVMDAVNGDAAASALVTVSLHSTDDGTGTVPAVAKANLAGGAEGGSSDVAVGYVLADCANGADAQVSLY